MLSRRLQVLIDDDRYERLKDESERQGAPVGELVRRAIDDAYPPTSLPLTAKEAARSLLAHPPEAGPEPDWEAQKARLLDELSGDGSSE